ncbi:unnamed protein product, partial [Musa acuminata subsp. burmannicoides]
FSGFASCSFACVRRQLLLSLPAHGTPVHARRLRPRQFPQLHHPGLFGLLQRRGAVPPVPVFAAGNRRHARPHDHRQLRARRGRRRPSDGCYHGDDQMLASLSTGWCDDGSRCSKNIKINANGQTVLAKVMDECDSLHGCDQEHAFQPPCAPDIVDASRAVWEALGIPESQIGDDGITWSDE